MSMLKGHVQNGRVVVDSPTSLPEGAEVELIPVDAWQELDEGDELDDGERERLHAALDASEGDVASSRTRPAAKVMAELSRR